MHSNASRVLQSQCHKIIGQVRKTSAARAPIQDGVKENIGDANKIHRKFNSVAQLFINRANFRMDASRQVTSIVLETINGNSWSKMSAFIMFLIPEGT